MQIRPIRTAQDYQSAIQAIAPFTHKVTLTQDESDYLEVMQILIRTYRQEHRNEVTEPSNFTYDLERMKRHIECESVEVPKFATLEELEKWMKSE